MGAWGHKTFENDAAADWLGDLTEGDPSLVGEALDVVGDSDEEAYVDVDEACAALAAAELVAAAHGKGVDRLNEGAASWLEHHRSAVRRISTGRARKAVERVLEASELSELWGENGGECEWHRDVRELLTRLA